LKEIGTVVITILNIVAKMGVNTICYSWSCTNSCY